MLEFKVDKQIITRTDTTEVVADSRNYLTASFTFSDEWKDRAKTAVFGYNGEYRHTVLENDGCLVPWEVIRAPYFSVSVFCGSLLNTNMVLVKVGKSGLDGGEIPGTPTPTVWQGYIDELTEKNDEIADGMADEISARVSKSIKEYADTKAATAQTNAESKAASLAQAAQAAAVEYANGELAKKADSDDLPTKLSQLSDDVGYAKKTDIASTYKYKGEISSLAELGAITAPEVGDTYNVSADMTYVGLPIKSTDMTSWEWTKNDNGDCTGISFSCSLKTFPKNSILYAAMDFLPKPAYIYRENAVVTEMPMTYTCMLGLREEGAEWEYCAGIDFTSVSAEFQWDTVVLGYSEPLQLKAGDNIAWNGTSWDNLSGFVDLTPYAKKTEVAADIAAAKQAAVDAAATDAQSRANQALSSANSYTDSQIDEITIPIMSESAYAAAVFTDGKAVIVLPDGVLEG